MARQKTEEKLDKTVADSFPASDPPATSGITGPRAVPPERDEDSRPKGSPTDERHATETAYQREDEKRPRQ